jgi:hypothetical protein
MPADQPDDLDETFARIVADYDASPDASDRAPWPAQEDVDDAAPPVLAAAVPAPPPERSDTDPLNTTATWEDEGHFVPPTPPPVPHPAPLTLAAWCGVLGAPLAFLLAALAGWVLPRLVTGVLVLGFVAGVVVLIAMTSRRGDDYDPDDGAVV